MSPRQRGAVGASGTADMPALTEDAGRRRNPGYGRISRSAPPAPARRVGLAAGDDDDAGRFRGQRLLRGDRTSFLPSISASSVGAAHRVDRPAASTMAVTAVGFEVGNGARLRPGDDFRRPPTPLPVSSARATEPGEAASAPVKAFRPASGRSGAPGGTPPAPRSAADYRDRPACRNVDPAAGLVIAAGITSRRSAIAVAPNVTSSAPGRQFLD